MASAKKRRPPTFQHYPENRAKKLKRDWVDTKKIKKQWRAEKSKMGLTEPKIDWEEEEWKGIQLEKEKEHVHEEEEEACDEDEGELEPSPPPKPPQSGPQQEKQKPSEENRQSLREMARQAYSRSSLHSFKSDPLHRKRGAADSKSMRSERGRGPRRQGRGRGRGQPNMKLRMDVLLERIKRNLAE